MGKVLNAGELDGVDKRLVEIVTAAAGVGCWRRARRHSVTFWRQGTIAAFMDCSELLRDPRLSCLLVALKGGGENMAEKLLCFAEGHGDTYEAICVDLDLAVHGRSMREVVSLLNKAVESYVDDAMKEDEATARRLLSRRAPWHVRLGHKLRFATHLLTRRRRNGGEEASFDVICPA